jgi:hypothetical protein
MPGSFSRPLGLKDADYADIPDTFSDEAFQGQYTGTNLIYKGFAKPGASVNEPVWQIAFLTYDGSNNVLSIQWPLRKSNPYDATSADTNAPSNDYEFIWAQRTSYTYV